MIGLLQGDSSHDFTGSANCRPIICSGGEGILLRLTNKTMYSRMAAVEYSGVASMMRRSKPLSGCACCLTVPSPVTPQARVQPQGGLIY
jgi:hypothetical protein